jgi:hypothetical protein
MKKKTLGLLALACVAQVIVPCGAQTKKSPYPTRAPFDQYLIPNTNSEIALARTAAPASISKDAEVLVLQHSGYVTAVKGTNGFVCLVERSWGASTDAPEFWNQKIRSPICVNPAAARTYLPALLFKTRLVFAGKPKDEIAQALQSAYNSKQLPALEPGAMSYMMSKQQYLNDDGKSWHPHLMWFIPGAAAKSWGANQPGSPVLASNDPEDHMTVFLVLVNNWSDGTPAPQTAN